MVIALWFLALASSAALFTWLRRRYAPAVIPVAVPLYDDGFVWAGGDDES